MKLEKRYIKFDSEAFELRNVKDDSGKEYFEGYPIIFNKKSRLIYERGKLFTETIKKESVSNVLSEENKNLDIILTFNHHNNPIPLARYRSGRKTNTIQFEIDDHGVKMRAEKGESQLANDLSDSIECGDIDGMSFVFSIDPKEGDKWYRDSEGKLQREILKMSSIQDFAIVVNPACSDTDTEVKKCSIEQFEESENSRPIKVFQKEGHQ